MTATINEIDLELLFDFEFETPCDVCDKEAKWRMVKACCGSTSLRCEEHKDRALTVYQSYLAQVGAVWCTACRATTNHPTGYAIVEPIDA